jgi:hypothetical protein
VGVATGVENGDLHPDFSGKPGSEWKYYGIFTLWLFNIAMV